VIGYRRAVLDRMLGDDQLIVAILIDGDLGNYVVDRPVSPRLVDQAPDQPEIEQAIKRRGQKSRETAEDADGKPAHVSAGFMSRIMSP
jgi:hypothetical protein